MNWYYLICTKTNIEWDLVRLLKVTEWEERVEKEKSGKLVFSWAAKKGGNLIWCDFEKHINYVRQQDPN